MTTRAGNPEKGYEVTTMALTIWPTERVTTLDRVITSRPNLGTLLSLGLATALGAVVAILVLSAFGFVARAPRAGAELEDPITRVYREALPGVVQIVDRSLLEKGPRQAAIGSGFVVDLDGHVMTNRHVIQGIRNPGVALSDGGIFEAEVIGEDRSHDLAVLKVAAPGERLHPLTLGDSSRLEVGRRVLAIGSPFGLAQTLTSGVVSFVGRPFAVNDGDPLMDTIQTDAAINPGNSGGPLLDLDGEVIGIDVATYAKAIGNFEAGSVGVGFAVPSNDAREILPEMIGGSLAARPWLGIYAREVGPSTVGWESGAVRQGAMITHVILGGPADEAGLRGASYEDARAESPLAESGDLIAAVDSRAIGSVDDLASYLSTSGKRVGDRVVLEVVRGTEVLEVSVKLQASDANLVGAI